MAVMIYLISILVALCTYLYFNFKKAYRFWATLRVPYIEPIIPFGNIKDATKSRHLIYITSDFYEELKSKREYVGLYFFKTPVLLATSADFAKEILVRDFNSFTDRGAYSNRKHDPLSWNLFFLEGQEWKTLRTKLSVAFTSSKMKTMFHTITDVADELVSYMDDKNVAGTECDTKNLMARFTIDVISSCVFGIEGNSIKNPNTEFMKIGMSVMRLSKIRHFLTFVGMVWREQVRQMGFRIFNQEATEFFTNMVHETIALRKEDHYHRNDLMQLMIEHLKLFEDSNEDDGLTIDEVAANSFIFFFAGFETSSTTLTVALYYLAHNEQIQNQAREEVMKVLSKHEGKLTYEGVNEMDLLERILLETLRLFPPVGTLHRVSNQKYTLPNGSVIPKGTFLIVPVYAMHHDADIFPDPEKFDPDRFTDEEKSKRHPFAYLPFGEGPRICIGARFAMLQTKIALAKLLSKYRVQTTENTPKKLQVDESSFSVVPKDGVCLQFEKI